MPGIDSDLIRGHIDTIILKALFEGDKYGYEICKEVEERSNGLYELKQPTLYSCLKRLESQKLISSYWSDSEIGGKRHYYKLTEEGKEVYQKNNDEWNRSRVIIDSLISDGERPNVVFTAPAKVVDNTEEVKDLKNELEKLQKELEETKKQKDEYREQIEEIAKSSPAVSDSDDDENDELETVSFDENEDVVPWNDQENTSKPETFTEGDQTVKIIQLSDNFYATVAPNGEILSVEKASDKEKSESETAEPEMVSPAQASVFEEPSELVFDEKGQEESASDVDILELLGHTSKPQIEHEEKPQIASGTKEQSETYVESEDIKPLKLPKYFGDDEEVNSYSFYDSADQDVLSSDPVIKSDLESVKREEHTLDFNEELFAKQPESLLRESEEPEVKEENQTEEVENVDISAPVYHDFGAIKRPYEEAKLLDDDLDKDAIYEDPDKKQTEEKVTSIFEDELVDNEPTPLFTADEEPETQLEAQEEQKPQILEPDFYKSTEAYENFEAKHTEGEFKEKLDSLMNYQTKEQHPTREVTEVKSLDELKEDFEAEGITVKTHQKSVKEAKSQKIYVETNKLSMVNAWTAYSIVAFITLLTYIIMNNYTSAFPSFGFSYKYFLIGLGILLIVPVCYSIVFFINPYKKKQVRFASRMYLLFAVLLTIQLLILIYCINLQLGFYSFRQENYNHLYWIVPLILSFYPILDAVMRIVYFNSKNFHK